MRELTINEFRFYLDRGITAETAEKALNRACLIVENDAKKRCPVGRTGLLRNSIQHRVEREWQEYAGVVGTNVEYAPYVEFGVGVYSANGDGRQTPWVYPTADGEFVYVHNDGRETEAKSYGPRPFLEPALVENINEVKAEILETIKGELFQ